MAFVDDFTEIRIAGYDTLAKHIAAGNTIWTDASAVDMSGNMPSGDSYMRWLSEGWDGLDMPEYDVSYTPMSDGFGEAETVRALRGREITTPILSDILDKTEIAKLKAILTGNNRLVVGFKYPDDSDNRYMLMCRYTSGLNIVSRGNQPWTNFPLNIKSGHPFMVSPQIQMSGAAARFTPTGVDERVVWGADVSGLTSDTVVFTIAGKSVQFTFDTRPDRLVFVAGGPWSGLKFYTSAGLQVFDIRAVNKTGDVPAYLSVGTQYNAQVSGGAAQFFYLRNYEGV